MKSIAFGLTLVLGSATFGQSQQASQGPAAPAPETEAARPLPAPSSAIPPAISVDKNCAEAIGSTPDTPSPGTSPTKDAAGGPPISPEAKKTGCMIELPEKGEADQQPPQPPK